MFSDGVCIDSSHCQGVTTGDCRFFTCGNSGNLNKSGVGNSETVGEKAEKSREKLWDLSCRRENFVCDHFSSLTGSRR